MRDNTVTIDYRYLWDLICNPNPNLFEKGTNLVILEFKDDDITNNIQLICPSNYYSSSFFDVGKNTIIIMKKGNYYEPINSFEDKGNVFSITRRFSAKYNEALPNITKTLKLIKKMSDKCSPLPSMPSVYKFGKNITITKGSDVLILSHG